MFDAKLNLRELEPFGVGNPKNVWTFRPRLKTMLLLDNSDERMMNRTFSFWKLWLKIQILHFRQISFEEMYIWWNLCTLYFTVLCTQNSILRAFYVCNKNVNFLNFVLNYILWTLDALRCTHPTFLAYE